MTDIVEQAARVLDKAMAANIYKRFDPATGPTFGESIAQALADAGLLRDEVKVREGVCLECGGGVLNNGEHIDPSRHRDYVRTRDSRTVPTRDEIARAILMVTQAENIDPGYAWDVQFPEVQDELLAQADAVLSLMAGQPAVAEAKAQALEEAADAWHAENAGTSPRAYRWLQHRAQQHRDGK